MAGGRGRNRREVRPEIKPVPKDEQNFKTATLCLSTSKTVSATLLLRAQTLVPSITFVEAKERKREIGVE